MQKYAEVERLVKELSSREKALNVLINNAGAVWGETLDEFPASPIHFFMFGMRLLTDIFGRMTLLPKS